MSNPIIKLNTLLSARGYDKGLYFTHEECTYLYSLITNGSLRIAELEAELKNARELIGMTPEPAFPAWIPVSERLPEDKLDVLAVSRGGLIISCFIDEYKMWYAPCADRLNVTHWMPLPTPPEVQK